MHLNYIFIRNLFPPVLTYSYYLQQHSSQGTNESKSAQAGALSAVADGRETISTSAATQAAGNRDGGVTGGSRATASAYGSRHTDDAGCPGVDGARSRGAGNVGRSTNGDNGDNGDNAGGAAGSITRSVARSVGRSTNGDNWDNAGGAARSIAGSVTGGIARRVTRSVAGSAAGSDRDDGDDRRRGRHRDTGLLASRESSADNLSGSASRAVGDVGGAAGDGVNDGDVGGDGLGTAGNTG